MFEAANVFESDLQFSCSQNFESDYDGSTRVIAATPSRSAVLMAGSGGVAIAQPTGYKL
jgi:hypothetical protein